MLLLEVVVQFYLMKIEQKVTLKLQKIGSKIQPKYNNSFRVLVDTAKIAKKSGVIKGILLHQGESDIRDKNWPKNVKLIYDRILEELKLKEEDVPLLVEKLFLMKKGEYAIHTIK